MQAFMYIVGMLGGIMMATAVPVLLVLKCGFENADGLMFVMVISVVSIGCGFALCRHCILASSGNPTRPDTDDNAS